MKTGTRTHRLERLVKVVLRMLVNEPRARMRTKLEATALVTRTLTENARAAPEGGRVDGADVESVAVGDGRGRRGDDGGVGE